MTCFVCGKPSTGESDLGWTQEGEGAPIVAGSAAFGRQAYCDRHFPREEGQEIDVEEFPK